MEMVPGEGLAGEGVGGREEELAGDAGAADDSGGDRVGGHAPPFWIMRQGRVGAGEVDGGGGEDALQLADLVRGETYAVIVEFDDDGTGVGVGVGRAAGGDGGGDGELEVVKGDVGGGIGGGGDGEGLGGFDEAGGDGAADGFEEAAFFALLAGAGEGVLEKVGVVEGGAAGQGGTGGMVAGVVFEGGEGVVDGGEEHGGFGIAEDLEFEDDEFAVGVWAVEVDGLADAVCDDEEGAIDGDAAGAGGGIAVGEGAPFVNGALAGLLEEGLQGFPEGAVFDGEGDVGEGGGIAAGGGGGEAEAALVFDFGQSFGERDVGEGEGDAGGAGGDGWRVNGSALGGGGRGGRGGGDERGGEGGGEREEEHFGRGHGGLFFSGERDVGELEWHADFGPFDGYLHGEVMGGGPEERRAEGVGGDVRGAVVAGGVGGDFDGRLVDGGDLGVDGAPIALVDGGPSFGGHGALENLTTRREDRLAGTTRRAGRREVVERGNFDGHAFDGFGAGLVGAGGLEGDVSGGGEEGEGAFEAADAFEGGAGGVGRELRGKVRTRCWILCRWRRWRRGRRVIG